ncbi:helix-turn-helix domain-containing protein [Paenibacillus sp. MAH-36]|uniref:Helix-turn-helix domain-containing protein n=1 Tax=Paenibacillus violae TaxID=3077234 RepID=A0ABU3RNF3_9BACL|nr:helix-turn-helix domain-containing protein [Paenibacillus sp. PFR10]MDU0205820.1 helix-turn-helix domain-containing protein [Paenibacillus sp. PFR10]
MFRVTDARRKQLLILIEEWMDKQTEEDSIFNNYTVIARNADQNASFSPSYNGVEVQPSKILLSVKELSDYLGISQDCVYTMVRENQIPYVRLRRRILFYKDSIDAWLRRTI